METVLRPICSPVMFSYSALTSFAENQEDEKLFSIMDKIFSNFVKLLSILEAYCSLCMAPRSSTMSSILSTFSLEIFPSKVMVYRFPESS